MTHREHESAIDALAHDAGVALWRAVGDYPHEVAVFIAGGLLALVLGQWPVVVAVPLAWCAWQVVLTYWGSRLQDVHPIAGRLIARAARSSRGNEERRYRRRLARTFEAALVDCGLVAAGAHPAVHGVAATPSGYCVDLALPRGMDPVLVAHVCGALAATLRVQECTVDSGTAHAGHVRLLVRVREPLARPLPDPFPVLAHLERGGRLDAHVDQVPLGLDEHARVVATPLFERNFALAGEPGSGKSCAAQELIAGLAADPTCALVLVDLKGGLEAKCWRARADILARSVPEAVAALRSVCSVIDDRLDHVWGLEGGARKIGPDVPIVGVVIDEAAQLTGAANADKATRDESVALLTRIASLGRALGVVLVIATQKTTGESIPTGVRDLISTRWALRVTSRAASEAILGPLGDDLPCRPWEIPKETPGVGLFTTDRGDRVKMRSYDVSDRQLARLAELTAAARSRALAAGAWAISVPTVIPTDGAASPRRRRR